jgi:2'-5' RNA ligase
VRLFLAVTPDREGQAQLGRRALELQRSLGDAASLLRWTQVSNIHATLHFLGEIQDDHLGPICTALGRSLPEPAFEISLGEAGVFPQSGAPRVLWLAIADGAAALRRLHRELGQRLRSAGVEPEDRDFSPHVTLARTRDRSDRREVARVRDRLPHGHQIAIAWRVDRVTLYRSDLSGPVPRYEAVHQIDLGAAPGPN